MKKKILLMGTAAVLTMAAIIGTTLAGFNTETKLPGVTEITTKALSIDVVGTNVGNGVSQEAAAEVALAPGGNVMTPYYVVNNVEGGYDLYTRVTIYKYWEDNGRELEADKISLFVGNEENPTELKTPEGQAVKLDNDWILWYSDEEQVILYYTKPLAPGETTSNVLDFIGTDVSMDNRYTDASVQLAVNVDAVQKAAVMDAMPAEWGVYPQLDADGTIVAIEE